MSNEREQCVRAFPCQPHPLEEFFCLEQRCAGCDAIAVMRVDARQRTVNPRMLLLVAFVRGYVTVGDIPKGDALAAARIAGGHDARRTPDLLPLS